MSKSNLSLISMYALRSRPPVVGVLGCMAERLKERLFSAKTVDIVAGPDALRSVPDLIDLFIQVVPPGLALDTPALLSLPADVAAEPAGSQMHIAARHLHFTCRRAHFGPHKVQVMFCFNERSTVVQRSSGGADDAGPERLMNVQLSAEETYADITPVRPLGAVCASVSIMRGCNNMCATGFWSLALHSRMYFS